MHTVWVAMITRPEIDAEPDITVCRWEETAQNVVILYAQELLAPTNDEDTDEWNDMVLANVETRPYIIAKNYLLSQGYGVYVQIHDVVRIVM